VKLLVTLVEGSQQLTALVDVFKIAVHHLQLALEAVDTIAAQIQSAALECLFGMKRKYFEAVLAHSVVMQFIPDRQAAHITPRHENVINQRVVMFGIDECFAMIAKSPKMKKKD